MPARARFSEVMVYHAALQTVRVKNLICLLESIKSSAYLIGNFFKLYIQLIPEAVSAGILSPFLSPVLSLSLFLWLACGILQEYMILGANVLDELKILKKWL